VAMRPPTSASESPRSSGSSTVRPSTRPTGNQRVAVSSTKRRSACCPVSAISRLRRRVELDGRREVAQVHPARAGLALAPGAVARDQGIELAAEVAELLRGDRDHGIRDAEQVDPGGWPGVGGVEPVLGALGELAHIVALQPLESGAGVIVVVAKARVGPR